LGSSVFDGAYIHFLLLYEIDSGDCRGGAKMKEWLYYQFEHFNVLMIIVMVIFVTAMSKSNTTKLLKEQSQEIYAEFEEIKDEIRGNANK
jgi:hypothetical protein